MISSQIDIGIGIGIGIAIAIGSNFSWTVHTSSDSNQDAMKIGLR